VVTTRDADDEPGLTSLPTGSVVPGADIWDDDDDWEPEPLRLVHSDGSDVDSVPASAEDDDGDDEAWLVEAQIVQHASDVPNDGSAGIVVDDDDGREAFGSKLQRWSGTTALGMSLSGIGIGLEKAIFNRDPMQIEIEVDGDEDDHLDPVKVKLDQEHPDRSVAVLRPWLQDHRHPSTQDDVPSD
jgi:hypothetical protein